VADNVAITAGSGTTIATDDISGVHYQRVKLVDGTLDGTGAIGGDATNGLDVDVTRVQGTVTTGGVAAHDAGISGNPVRVAGRARTSSVTAVSNDDVADFISDTSGKQVVRPHCIPENSISGVASATGTGNTEVIAAQAAGVRIYLANISVANASAATNSIVEIKDGTTVVWRTANPAGGGSNIHFDPPLRLTAATALNFASLTGTTTAYFCASGYIGA
jgi:hypothetical protein